MYLQYIVVYFTTCCIDHPPAKMSFSVIRRVAVVGAKKTPVRAFSGHEIPTEAALSYSAKDAVEKVSHAARLTAPLLYNLKN